MLNFGRNKFSVSFVAGLALLAMGTASSANTKNFNIMAKYDITFLGLSVGKMKNSMKVNGNQYSIAGGARTSSVVELLAGVRASFSSSGKIVDDRIVPASFKVDFKTRKKKGKIGLNYSNGNITGVSAAPKIKYKPGAVPVEKSHLRNVIDPLSSLLFPVKSSQIGNGPSICNRTIPVFDGKSRINLVFSYKSKSKARAKGFKGTVYNCAVRYQPVSGIRPHKKNIKFMKANRDMEITVARVGDTNMYALFGFNVRTDKGRAKGWAYHFAKR